MMMLLIIPMYHSLPRGGSQTTAKGSFKGTRVCHVVMFSFSFSLPLDSASWSNKLRMALSSVFFMVIGSFWSFLRIFTIYHFIIFDLFKGHMLRLLSPGARFRPPLSHIFEILKLFKSTIDAGLLSP